MLRRYGEAEGTTHSYLRLPTSGVTCEIQTANCPFRMSVSHSLGIAVERGAPWEGLGETTIASWDNSSVHCGIETPPPPPRGQRDKTEKVTNNLRMWALRIQSNSPVHNP